LTNFIGISPESYNYQLFFPGSRLIIASQKLIAMQPKLKADSFQLLGELSTTFGRVCDEIGLEKFSGSEILRILRKDLNHQICGFWVCPRRVLRWLSSFVGQSVHESIAG
jgi:hypothetical protein